MGTTMAMNLVDDGGQPTKENIQNEDTDLTEDEQRRLLRRIDWRLLPMLFLIYLMAFLDRANIGNALTLGLEEDLSLTGSQPNIALLIFFVPYIVLEIPSNIILKKMTPHVWMSLCMTGFGIAMLAQGFVTNYAGLLATRFFLGVFEAGVFPGSFYLISFWYKRQEAQTRYTVYFSSILLASAFSGLLASAIAKMDGVGGKSSWRWVFIFEGILTIIAAAMAFFLICDFPDQAKWLTDRERHFIHQKTRQDDKTTDDKITLRDIGEFVKHPEHHVAALMYFCAIVPAYAFVYFVPTVIKTLGYNTVQIQLHSVPPYAAAFALCMILAIAVGRTDVRFPYYLLSSAIAIAGLAILLSVHDGFSVRYLGICLTVIGLQALVILCIGWYLVNLHGHKERSIGSAWMIGFGNMGGFVAPFAFLSKYKPEYRPGLSMCIGIAALGVATACAYAGLIVRKRRRMMATGNASSTPLPSL